MFAFLCLLLLGGQGFGKSAAPMKVPQSCFFVANEGQWEEPFSFKLSAGAATYFVTQEGMTIDLREYEREAERSRLDELDPFERDRKPELVSVRGHVLKVNFVGGNLQAVVKGEDKLASYSNYFLGRDSCNWRSRVGHYQRVVMEEVWNGIDVELRAQPNGVETVYRVKPGADPSQIEIEYEGLDAPLHTDSQGNLILTTTLGNLTEKAPWAYQIIGNRQQEVVIEFQVIGENHCILNPEAYNRATELVVDPLIYASYFGGTFTDWGTRLEHDPSGAIVIVGDTDSDDFPTTPGAYQEFHSGAGGFVSKFTSDGTSLLFSTYFNGLGGQTSVTNLFCDGASTIFVIGVTSSHDWPVTDNAIQTLYGGGGLDAIVVELNATGDSLLYSTYFGGQNNEYFHDVLATGNNRLYLVGSTFGLPSELITPNALFSEPDSNGEYATYNGLFTIIDIQTFQLYYSSYLPGNAETRCVTLDVSENRMWIGGLTYADNLPVTNNAYQSQTGSPGDQEPDGFVTLWDIELNELAYSTYLGGDHLDYIPSLALIDDETVVVGGQTRSLDFPVTSGVFDSTHGSSIGHFAGFISILNASGALLRSTLLTSSEGLEGIGTVFVDSFGIVAGGETSGDDFPLTPGAVDTTTGGNETFVVRLSSDLTTLLYSTRIGGGADLYCDIELTNPDTVWVLATTGSTSFPTTPNAYRRTGGGHGNIEVVFAQIAMPPLTSVHIPPVEIPDLFSVRVYPNPFNAVTWIDLALPQSSPVDFVLYDLLGRTTKVITLPPTQAGLHRVPLNAGDLPSGTYFLETRTNFKANSQKLLLLR